MHAISFLESCWNLRRRLFDHEWTASNRGGIALKARKLNNEFAIVAHATRARFASFRISFFFYVLLAEADAICSATRRHVPLIARGCAVFQWKLPCSHLAFVAWLGPVCRRRTAAQGDTACDSQMLSSRNNSKSETVGCHKICRQTAPYRGLFFDAAFGNAFDIFIAKVTRHSSSRNVERIWSLYSYGAALREQMQRRIILLLFVCVIAGGFFQRHATSTFMLALCGIASEFLHFRFSGNVLESDD